MSDIIQFPDCYFSPLQMRADWEAQRQGLSTVAATSGIETIVQRELTEEGRKQRQDLVERIKSEGYQGHHFDASSAEYIASLKLGAMETGAAIRVLGLPGVPELMISPNDDFDGTPDEAEVDQLPERHLTVPVTIDSPAMRAMPFLIDDVQVGTTPFVMPLPADFDDIIRPLLQRFGLMSGGLTIGVIGAHSPEEAVALARAFVSSQNPSAEPKQTSNNVIELIPDS